MQIRALALAALVVLSLSPERSVVAATVDAVEGEVLVNTGRGYQPAKSPHDVRSGDKVMARPGGSALLVYDAGCVVPVGAGRVIAVATTPPCPKTSASKWTVEVKSQVIDTGAVSPLPPVGGAPPVESAVEATPGADASAAASSGWNAGPLLVGGVVVGGGLAAAAVIASQKSSGKPASP